MQNWCHTFSERFAYVYLKLSNVSILTPLSDYIMQKKKLGNIVNQQIFASY